MLFRPGCIDRLRGADAPAWRTPRDHVLYSLESPGPQAQPSPQSSRSFTRVCEVGCNWTVNTAWLGAPRAGECLKDMTSQRGRDHLLATPARDKSGFVQGLITKAKALCWYRDCLGEGGLDSAEAEKRTRWQGCASTRLTEHL